MCARLAGDKLCAIWSLANFVHRVGLYVGFNYPAAMTASSRFWHDLHAQIILPSQQIQRGASQPENPIICLSWIYATIPLNYAPIIFLNSSQYFSLAHFASAVAVLNSLKKAITDPKPPLSSGPRMMTPSSVMSR
jgi:hypothetical protein